MTSCSLRALHFRHVLLFSCLFLILLLPSLSAQTTPICAASPEVQSALEQVPAFQPADQPQYQWALARRAALQNLLREHPGDAFIQSAYVSSMGLYESDAVKVIAEYEARHKQHPDDARISYLYAKALLGRDTPQATKLFNDALAKDPDFFPTRLELVSIYTSPTFLDKPQAISLEKSFLSACPAALEGYRTLQQIDDKNLIAQSVPKLRQILEPRSDPPALRAYSVLWSLEFKARPTSEYDAVRKQVSADLGRLRVLNLQNRFEWWDTLARGYKLTNDTKEYEWAKNGRQAHCPIAQEELTAEEKWTKEHPRPNDDAPYDQKLSYDRDLLQVSADWIKQRPNTLFIWYSRLAPMEDLDEVPASDVQACIAKMLELAQADAGPNPIDARTRLDIAEAIYKRKLDPQQQVEMARKGVEQLEAEIKEPPYDLFYGKKELDDLNFYQVNQKTQGLFYEADGYVRLKQSDGAHAALAQFDQSLQAMKGQINDKDDRHKSFIGQESLYWNAMAHLAQLQNRKLDAMAYYQSALLDRLDSGTLPAPGQKDDLGDDAHSLWASLDGTEDGWKSWYGDRAAALASQSHLTWEAAQDPLPSFQLTDLQGKTWQLADLKGKVVFLNFWASW